MLSVLTSNVINEQSWHKLVIRLTHWPFVRRTISPTDYLSKRLLVYNRGCCHDDKITYLAVRYVQNVISRHKQTERERESIYIYIYIYIYQHIISSRHIDICISIYLSELYYGPFIIKHCIFTALSKTKQLTSPSSSPTPPPSSPSPSSSSQQERNQ